VVKPIAGRMICTYCGAENPDSESVCSNTGGRHSLASSSDKQELGMGQGAGPGLDVDPSDLHGSKTKDHKVGHGFAQTDTVKHCPFCGSGDVWGGSDGTITCEFDGATFQVSVEPQFPSAPGNIDGVPLNVDGAPDQEGQADAEDSWAVPNNLDPSAGSDLDVGGGPEGGYSDDDEGGPAEDEDGPPPFPPKQSARTLPRFGIMGMSLSTAEGGPGGFSSGGMKYFDSQEEAEQKAAQLSRRKLRTGGTYDYHVQEFLEGGEHKTHAIYSKGERRVPSSPHEGHLYRTHAGDLLSEPLYLKHLAIRHAEVPQRFLASLRSGR
jgi:hypothetical protein